MKQSHKTIAGWVILVLLAAWAFKFWNVPTKNEKQITYSEFKQTIKEGKIEKVTFKQGETKRIHGEYKPSTEKPEEKQYFTLESPLESKDIADLCEQFNVAFNYEAADKSSFWQQMLISWLPLILIFGFFFFFMRQIQVGGGKALAFGKSRAKLMTEHKKKVTFKDVAGVEEAKEELQEIVEFLKNPKKFTRLGGKIPKGVLLVGSPGTGKTLLAKAIAGEAGVPFFNISGSEFVEMFVGVGASRVRDLFEQGKKSAPCIIFIDEIDAVGRHRGAGLGGGHDEREQTLNQLLVEMDGFESKEGVILVAATNRPDVLDPALLRPGRFDRRVIVPTPDVKGREEILKVHSRNTPLDKDVELAVVARSTPGFTGADLANLVNEAALLASRYSREALTMYDFEQAKDKVLMGSERRSMIISDEEKENTAYHEAGHTLVSKIMGGTDPIHKVTIIPRGAALGLTQTLPVDDKHSFTKEYAENNIAFAMGGRVAEEVIFSHQTTGAGNDFEKATEIARRMVCEWGMSDKLGPLTFGKKNQNVFLGKEIEYSKEYSEKTAEDIDGEIKSIVMRNYDRAKKVILENKDSLERIAKALLEFETLTGEEVDRLIAGVTVDEFKKERELIKKDASNAAALASAESVQKLVQEPAKATKKTGPSVKKLKPA
ncbi:MAG: ATP-dependent metallopeptidase FtsH/Yme1/Tma family protein [Deltaproteobacteria bacterium]|nr:ATP-dependent metallopeptidase FtsH/Yme1/Tma family protein [Deltaproteobacteria bacterium]